MPRVIQPAHRPSGGDRPHPFRGTWAEQQKTGPDKPKSTPPKKKAKRRK